MINLGFSFYIFNYFAVSFNVYDLWHFAATERFLICYCRHWHTS